MIIRRRHKRRYTVIHNDAIEDRRLSFKALGLLSYLLSRPDGWNANYRHLMTTHDTGEHAVRTGLQELEEHGYLRRERFQNTDGTWGWQCVIQEAPCGDFPGTDNPVPENPRNKQVREEQTPDRPDSGPGPGLVVDEVEEMTLDDMPDGPLKARITARLEKGSGHRE